METDPNDIQFKPADPIARLRSRNYKVHVTWGALEHDQSAVTAILDTGVGQNLVKRTTSRKDGSEISARTSV